MNEQEIRARLANIKCFLLDMDGTFYLGDKLIDGSLAFLNSLEQTGRQALFLTNNSSKSAQYYICKLQRMGVQPPFLNVLTSGQVAARYALRNFKGKKAYLLGNDLLHREAAAAGMSIDDANPNYVMIAYDTELTYRKLNDVCAYVRSGLPYIATHPDLNCPTENGFAPDIGAIIAFIKASTGREPDLILGKPYPQIMEYALQTSGFPAANTAMAGDRLYTDIAAGINAGMTSVLVLSGETTMDTLVSSKIQPDLVFGRLSDMIPYLNQV